MCTVQLTYDPNNALAQKSLAALLATGQFIADEATQERFSIDCSDPWLYEEGGDLPPLPEKESFTPEEVIDIITKDIRRIYEEDAVCISA